jgi:hypothetical protein
MHSGWSNARVFESVWRGIVYAHPETIAAAMQG